MIDANNNALQLELGEAKGQLRAAKAASTAAYERVEALAAQLASAQGVSPLGLILRPSRVRDNASTRMASVRMVLKSSDQHPVHIMLSAGFFSVRVQSKISTHGTQTC